MSANKFKVGDVVKCVDDYSVDLTLGKSVLSHTVIQEMVYYIYIMTMVMKIVTTLTVLN